jgi:hypothetical protein
MTRVPDFRRLIERFRHSPTMRAALLAALLVGGWVILNRRANALSLGGEIILLALGFGFIPDLIDGHGDGQGKPKGLSRIEAEVRDLLDCLGEDFFVLHDVCTPHGTLRQVVISRVAGVFLVEAMPERQRTQTGDGTPDGRPVTNEPHVVDQCTERAYWLRERITEIVGEKPWITPLLVVPNAFVPQDLKLEGVRIINKARLVSTLCENAGRRRRSSLIWGARKLIGDSLEG